MYISAASTISHQPTFRNDGFSTVIGPLENGSEVMAPNFKDFIEAGLLRRMSKILRMSVACAKDCIEQAKIDQPDSIVVGTGLGCLQDTEKFLNNFLTIEGLLPPTAFIQSTHNTIAGQISLSMGNHGYNMTHTQNSLSFEHALLDALLLLGEDDRHVLVGAADEYIPILDEIIENLHFESGSTLTSGASFFVLSEEKSVGSLAKIADVRTFGLVKDIPESIALFLKQNELTAEELDMVLFPAIGLDTLGKVFTWFEGKLDASKFVDYLQFAGLYPTVSAFGLHHAIDRIRQDKQIRQVLICNWVNRHNLGLILVRSIEA